MLKHVAGLIQCSIQLGYFKYDFTEFNMHKKCLLDRAIQTLKGVSSDLEKLV